MALDQGGVHVQGRHPLRRLALQEGQERPIDPLQTRKSRRRLRDEGLAGHATGLLRLVVKPLQPGQERRGRRQLALPAAPETPLQLPPLTPRQERLLELLDRQRKARVRLQLLQVRNPIAAAKVQGQQGHDHLNVQPALQPGRLDVSANRRPQARRLDQVEIDPKTRISRQTRRLLLRRVLECQDPLCHLIVTPLVIVLFRKRIMNPFGFNTNGELQAF